MLLRILQKDSTRLSWYLDFLQTEGFSAIREMVRGLTDLSTELDRVATTQGSSLSPMQVFGNDNHNGTITIVDNKIYEVILTCRRGRSVHA
jgi:IS30 family transposase